MSEKQKINPIRRFPKPLWKWALPALVLVVTLTVSYLYQNELEVSIAVPPSNNLLVTPTVNPLLLVNSTEPVALNKELAIQAEKQDEHEFNLAGDGRIIFSGINTMDDADIAAIAYGKLRQTFTKVHEYQTHYTPVALEKIYPGKPLLVKSYQGSDYADYYLVPFIQDDQFVAQAVVSVLREEPGRVRYESIGVFGLAADRFLPVDIEQARNLIQTEKGLAQAPVPRLVFHQDLLPDSQVDKVGPLAYHQPVWEFALNGNSLCYVNQAGEVLAKDILPWYEKLTLLPYDPEKTQIEGNTLRRDDGWHIKVEKVELMGAYPYDPFVQGVQIYCLVENSISPDQFFMPSGAVIGLTSADGKTYPIHPTLLDPFYISTQQWFMERDEPNNKPGRPDIALPELKPGQLKICLHVDDVDANAEKFTSLTYRDENGRDFIIPLDLTAVLAERTSLDDLTPATKPTSIPGKDWSISVTRLEFRSGPWSDKRLAAIDLTVSNNKGADLSFLPTGQVTGFIGSSGKLYTDNSPFSLEESYRSMEAYFAEKGRPMYQPGILTLSREVLVDARERNFTSVIYRDENGKKSTITLLEMLTP